MEIGSFISHIKKLGIETLIGVPDSTLKTFCDYISDEGREEFKHFVPANEGAAIGIAIGDYLATGRPACVYMQNSGLGNIVNPITSLANEEVYQIPILLLIGWRGDPGKQDEPQHKFMGRITESLLDNLEIAHAVVEVDTTLAEVNAIFAKARLALSSKQQFAIVVKRGSFENKKELVRENCYSLVREEAIAAILRSLNKDDPVVSTTGKISREVYEQSNAILGQHQQEFLTVGGMGHASMIAFGIAANKPEKRVYCIDGDGAVLMHMGSLAFIGKQQQSNLIHICLNNDAHESVGGMPTGAVGQSYSEVAKACGYTRTYQVQNIEELTSILKAVKEDRQLTFIEVKVALGSRTELGRPKETAVENKENFMKYHGEK